MSIGDLAALDQLKASWEAASAAKEAVTAAWFGVVAAFVGALVNAAVVVTAFMVQSRQSKSDKALAERGESQTLLGVTVAILESYAALITVSERVGSADFSNVEFERLRLQWAEKNVGHYLARGPSDYILVQDLLRVQSVLEKAISQIDYALSRVDNTYPIEFARAPLPLIMEKAADAIFEIHERAKNKQPELRSKSGIPPTLVGEVNLDPNK